MVSDVEETIRAKSESFTTTAITDEMLVAKEPVGFNVAVIWCVPKDRVVVEKEATPAVSRAVPRVPDWSAKVTDPVGARLPKLDIAVAVRVTF